MTSRQATAVLPILKRFRPRAIGLCAKNELRIEAKMRVRVRVSFVRVRVAQFVLFKFFFHICKQITLKRYMFNII